MTPLFAKKRKHTFTNFFQVNRPDDISPTINWVAHKTIVRGKLIQLASRVKWQKESKIIEQENKLAQLLLEQKRDPHQNLRTVGIQLQFSLTTKAEKTHE